jgi:glycerol-3-phosphate acyltransferase PlsY
MTIFLIATFLAVLLFEKSIAITAVVFLIFGDIFSKIFGMAFGRHRIFDKTIEGTLAFLGSVLITGYIIFFSPLNISLIVLICGGIVAPISEILPIDINDNFTVPILSGVAMTVALFFGY